MNDIVIRAENLGKLYRIGEREPYKILQEALKRPFHRLISSAHNKQNTSTSNENDRYIWALKNISFKIRRGEILGIIGRNGAGKTTLLKIFSRITEPTEGYAEVHGQVGSLLAVGTGFHPELTGRENIFLNGAILGMKKQEIKLKFDEIVTFSELEKFVDTPVKYYSSGMYTRLAFSVAAHLEPEILIVDEVLSVGDAAFQKKCLGKMDDVSKEGRTVLFVSHNMGAIQQLTTRCLLLDNGKLILDDTPVRTIEAYIKNLSSDSLFSGSFKTGIPSLYIESIELDKGQLDNGFNKPITFKFYLRTKKIINDLTIGLHIINSIGARIMTPRMTIPRLNSGDTIVSIILENPNLPPGWYSLNVRMNLGGIGSSIFFQRGVLSFEISDVGMDDPFLVSRRDKLGVCPPLKYHLQEIK